MRMMVAGRIFKEIVAFMCNKFDGLVYVNFGIGSRETLGKGMLFAGLSINPRMSSSSSGKGSVQSA
jgi:hypothetical protein